MIFIFRIVFYLIFLENYEWTNIFFYTFANLNMTQIKFHTFQNCAGTLVYIYLSCHLSVSFCLSIYIYTYVYLSYCLSISSCLSIELYLPISLFCGSVDCRGLPCLWGTMKKLDLKLQKFFIPIKLNWRCFLLNQLIEQIVNIIPPSQTPLLTTLTNDYYCYLSIKTLKMSVASCREGSGLKASCSNSSTPNRSWQPYRCRYCLRAHLSSSN